MVIAGHIRVILSVTVCAMTFVCVACPAVLADGVVTNLKDYEYRADGTPWRCTVYDAMSGKLKGRVHYASDGEVDKVERYDELGNKVEAAFYDANGALRTGATGWAAMRWWYQGKVCRLQIAYDEQGRQMERLFFSESGKLLGRHYRDDEDVNHAINAAMFKLLGPNNVAYYDPQESYRETQSLIAN